jgi:hypothetical protein
LLLLTADLEGAATALEARKVVRPTSIAGAKAETELVASAIAAKAPMMEEKRNIFQVIN